MCVCVCVCDNVIFQPILTFYSPQTFLKLKNRHYLHLMCFLWTYNTFDADVFDPHTFILYINIFYKKIPKNVLCIYKYTHVYAQHTHTHTYILLFKQNLYFGCD